MKKKVAITGGIILGVIAIIIGIFVFMDLRQESILKKELDSLTKLDITKDTIPMDIKTKNDYAVVEKTIKEYLKEYSDTIKDVMSIVESSELINCLSIDNLVNDRPSFTKTIPLLTAYQERLTKDYEILIDLSNENTIMKRIEEKNLDSYYNDFYKDLMLGDGFEDDFKTIIKNIEDTRGITDKVIDLDLQALNLLKNHPDIWYIEDGTIYIEDDAILEQYNDIIDQINGNTGLLS